LDAFAAAAAVAYALLSLSPWTLGFAGHATHFVVLFALAAFSACNTRSSAPERDSDWHFISCPAFLPAWHPS